MGHFTKFYLERVRESQRYPEELIEHFKPYEDEFRLDDKPPAYRRLCLNDDGTIDTELLWMEADE